MLPRLVGLCFALLGIGKILDLRLGLRRHARSTRNFTWWFIFLEEKMQEELNEPCRGLKSVNELRSQPPVSESR